MKASRKRAVQTWATDIVAMAEQRTTMHELQLRKVRGNGILRGARQNLDSFILRLLYVALSSRIGNDAFLKVFL